MYWVDVKVKRLRGKTLNEMDDEKTTLAAAEVSGCGYMTA